MIRYYLILLCMLFTIGLHAQESPNSRQARRMFNEAYQKVYGPQGSRLSYSVNIIGIYKAQGTIWTKGKSSKFVEDRYTAWNDQITYTRVDRKKRTVTIYRSDDESRDKYASKFTFKPDNYNYHIANDKRGYVITLKAKKGVKGIKEADVLLDHHTRNPISIRVKVGFFHTTIKITNFKMGGISDQAFVFPRHQYSNYGIIDNR
ncbi:hypothetical protein [Prevotella sp. P5-126]|uniref:hypothetical protein n=1 Tax=Prevotella sp. P5-126 TaxID=2024216 RepID=UPI001180FF6A|nr:hypothetical protein [Prevotella sp. P5-126]